MYRIELDHTPPAEHQDSGLAAVLAAIEGAGREAEEKKQYVEDEDSRPGEALVTSRIALLTNYLDKANKQQQESLATRQKEAGATLLARQQDNADRFHHEQEDLLRKQARNLSMRVDRLGLAHNTKLSKKEREQQEEETAMIVRLPRMFKDHSNAEEREMAVLERLRVVHKADRMKMMAQQGVATRKVKEKGADERAALLASIKNGWEAEQELAKRARSGLVQKLISERVWFERAVQMRAKLFAGYRYGLVAEGEVEELVFVDVDVDVY